MNTVIANYISYKNTYCRRNIWKKRDFYDKRKLYIDKGNCFNPRKLRSKCYLNAYDLKRDDFIGNYNVYTMWRILLLNCGMCTQLNRRTRNSEIKETPVVSWMVTLYLLHHLVNNIQKNAENYLSFSWNMRKDRKLSFIPWMSKMEGMWPPTAISTNK